MPHKKRGNSKPSSKQTAKVPLAPPRKAPKTPAPDEQADGSPKPTDTKTGSRGGPATRVRKREEAQVSAGARTWGTDTLTKDDRACNDGNASSLRCYSIPDHRLEKPEFRIY